LAFNKLCITYINRKTIL